MTTAIDFEALKADISISAVLGKYGLLPPTYRNHFRIHCPFSSEEDRDNFVIDDEAGWWWCHSCKEGGDVITLVAKFENCRNIEAAEMIMAQHGIVHRADEFIRTIRKTQKNMAGWRELQSAPPPLKDGDVPDTAELYAYRTFSKDAIDHFGLRLIPGTGWGSGIFIPIKTSDGELVGYSIRHSDEFLAEHFAEKGKKAPKYLNSEGLKKQGIMFGLYENKAAIRECGFAYLVEGQFDAIAMWDRGIKNVIGVMGSSLSPEQAQMLMKVTTKLVLMYDGDEPGRAGMRQVKNRFGSVFNIATITLPDGVDPATADLGAIINV